VPTPATDKFIAQLRGAKTIMTGVQQDAMKDAAVAVKPVMEGAARSMAGGDMKLHNNTNKSGKPKGGIKVRYQLGGDSMHPFARFSASGPIALMEKGAPPHMIQPRSRRQRKRGRPKAIQGAGYAHPIGRPIQHPGFRGKGRWSKARDNDVPPVARKAFVGRNVTAFRKAFS